MEMNRKPYELDAEALARPIEGKLPYTSVADLAAQIEAHEVFLKTPEGQEWEAMNRRMMEVESDLRLMSPPSPEVATLYEKIREMSKGFKIPSMIPTNMRPIQDLIPPGGFKRGELPIMFVKPTPRYECKSSLMFHMALKLREKNPDLKIVFPFSLEMSDFERDRFNESMRNMGIEPTSNNEGNTQ